MSFNGICDHMTIFCMGRKATKQTKQKTNYEFKDVSTITFHNLYVPHDIVISGGYWCQNVSDYNQEMPPSHTTDQPKAS